MTKRPIDRRVARTQAALHDALISLILEKGYPAITVEDICARANIGRSTFYAHYDGKESLHRSGMNRLRRQLLERRKGAAEPAKIGSPVLGFSLPMLEHARDHIDHYRAMVGRGGDGITHVRQMIADTVRDELGDKARDSMPREFVVQYIVGGFMAVLTWWLDGGAKLPPERIDAMFRRLIERGLNQLHGEDAA